MNSFTVLLLLSFASVLCGFRSLTNHAPRRACFVMKSSGDKLPSETSSSPLNNAMKSRSLLNQILSTSAAVLSSQLLVPAFSAKAVEVTKSSPVVVLGSGGKTGRLIVDLFSKANIPVKATYRSKPSDATDFAYADVTRVDTLGPAIEGASVVIFAASASNKGGNAAQVDYQGVVNVASECVRLKIPRLVVISSGAITRPDSLGFKFTNIFGGIMDYKLKGENAMRDLYASANDSNLGYVIIRPGGLGDEDASGPSKIELNQGDTISGEVSRADVAECTVAAALSKIIPSNVIFEMYQADRKGPLQGNFKQISGYEQRGSNYDEMFAKLKSGVVNI